MTARDTGFPLSTLCTTVDSGLGRGTANIQLHVQYITSQPKKKFEKDYPITIFHSAHKKQSNCTKTKGLNVSLNRAMMKNQLSLKKPRIWKQEK